MRAPVARAVPRRSASWAIALLACLALSPNMLNASNLNLGEMAALLVLPVITGGQPGNLEAMDGDVIIDSQRATTLVTVTNASSKPVILEIDVVSGDIGEDAWDTDSFECPLTGRETTTMVFSPAGSGKSTMHVECGRVIKRGNFPVDVETDGGEISVVTDTQNGFVVIAVGQLDIPRGQRVVSTNQIFADAIVVDPEGRAYAFDALSFQSGPEANDGDKVYRFGAEYAAFPSTVAANFIAESQENGVSAELLLLTLDGQLGGTPPTVSLTGHVYDDDETSRNFVYDFDCFDIVPLSELSNGFIYDPVNGLNLASPTGHFDLTSRNAGVAGPDPHDFHWGDDNSIRNRGTHGWIIQGVEGVLLNQDTPIIGVQEIRIEGSAAFAMPLKQATTGIQPAGSDSPPVLDAD